MIFRSTTAKNSTLKNKKTASKIAKVEDEWVYIPTRHLNIFLTPPLLRSDGSPSPPVKELPGKGKGRKSIQNAKEGYVLIFGFHFQQVPDVYTVYRAEASMPVYVDYCTTHNTVIHCGIFI